MLLLHLITLFIIFNTTYLPLTCNLPPPPPPPPPHHRVVPSQPLNLDYTNDTSTSVILTWATPTSPNGIIESYTLQISDVSTISTPVLVPNITNITNIDGNLVEYTLTGLLPFHTYELVLYALTDRGEGPGSTTLTLYTLEDREWVDMWGGG